MPTDPQQLQLLDQLFHAVHLSVMAINLFGWIHPRTRMLHRWVFGLTAISWLGIGLIVGVPGYCFLTDWHWQVKYALGEAMLPSSYVTYLLWQVGLQPDPQAINNYVATIFALLAGITVALWWQERLQRKPRQP